MKSMKCALKILKDYWNSKAATCNEDHLCRVTMHTGANDRWKWCREGRHPKDAAVRIGWSSLSTFSKLQGRWDPTTSRFVWSSAFQPGQLGLFCFVAPSLRMFWFQVLSGFFFRRTSRSPKALQSNFVTNSWKNSYWTSIDFPAISGTMSKISICSCQKTVENNWNIMKHHNKTHTSPSRDFSGGTFEPINGGSGSSHDPRDGTRDSLQWTSQRLRGAKRRRGEEETWDVRRERRENLKSIWMTDERMTVGSEKSWKKGWEISRSTAFLKKNCNCVICLWNQNQSNSICFYFYVFFCLTLICIPSIWPSALKSVENQAALLSSRQTENISHRPGVPPENVRRSVTQGRSELEGGELKCPTTSEGVLKHKHKQDIPVQISG